MVEKKAKKQVFFAFFFFGFVIASVCIGIWSCANVVWADFVHDNPYRTRENSWSMIMLSPIYGIIFTISLYMLPLLVGAVGAKLSSLRLGHVPFWCLVVLLLVCFPAFLLQGYLIFDSSDVEERRPILEVFAMFLAIQTPSLLGPWLWTRK